MDFIFANFSKIFFGIAGGVLLFFVIKNFAKVAKFLLQVRTELVKVSWPTRKEVMAATVIILVLTGFLTAYVGSVDLALSKILSIFLK
ncbi:MAG: preprotein translocase subunit SecE [Candidatus Omnitrophica bacterium]|nr:preprotein translocase subunit SecE [Candidatus Omnitrophota bacterium]